MKGYYFLIVLLTALALFIGKYFHLVLTIPLFIIGIVFLLASRIDFIKNNLIFKILKINIGLVFLLFSIIFSVLNINTFLKTPSKVSTKNIGEYKDLIKYNNRSEKLGYTYKKNISIRSKKIKFGSNVNQIIYDVNYSTDEYGNRRLPLSLSGIDDSILFLGCSQTFGEGLNDNQTLPYHFSKISGLKSINTGMHGYGTHQALMLISDEELIKERLGKKKISHVIYNASLSHISRAAGYAPWDKFSGPCYEINQKLKKIEYRGNFKSCKNRSSWISKLYYFIFDRMSVTNEPWTRKYFSRFHRRDFLRKNIKKQDEDRFISMVDDMNKKSKALGSKFIMLFNNIDLESPCNKNDYVEKIARKISAKGVEIYLYSNALNKNECLKDKYHIKDDGHISDFANKKLANGIFYKYFKN